MTARDAVVERFRHFAAGPEVDLFEGALLVSELVKPAEDLERARDRVGSLAERIRKVREAEGPPHEALKRVLFFEEGFRGDAEAYDDPANSSVAHVLETRRGMPITLSIVVLEAARRAGLS